MLSSHLAPFSLSQVLFPPRTSFITRPLSEISNLHNPSPNLVVKCCTLTKCVQIVTASGQQGLILFKQRLCSLRILIALPSILYSVRLSFYWLALVVAPDLDNAVETHHSFMIFLRSLALFTTTDSHTHVRCLGTLIATKSVPESTSAIRRFW